jgi:hypothetical protein
VLTVDGLELALVVAALVAGLTGTWSPCGFSMIETIGPVGHTGGRPTTLASCVSLAIGALVGGAITFGVLGGLGSLLHGAEDPLAYALAAMLALAAAFAEVRGVAIAPQVRRQLPEHWRRALPMPVAGCLYGVLLGLGFTTFVLTFAVFALAGIVIAVGEPAVGIAVGLAFGAGRALPIVVAAPFAGHPAGIRVTEAMAGRPGIYRGVRVGDGIALVSVAAALVTALPATASKVDAVGAADPAAADAGLVLERSDGSGILRRGGDEVALPGGDPAIGDGRVAVLRDDEIIVLSAADLTELGAVSAPGADAVAISGRWVAWRARVNGRDLIRARRLADPADPGPEHLLGRAGGAAQLGRPSLDDNRLVYVRASKRQNRIVTRLLGAKRKRRAKTTLMRSAVDGLSNPSIRGRLLLYVRHTRRADRLRLARVGGRRPGRTLLSRRRGTLWSTALSDRRAYVTQIAGAAPRQRILSVKR